MKKINRRNFIKTAIGASMIAPNIKAFSFDGIALEAKYQPLILDASKPSPTVLKNYLKTGTTKNPNGAEWTADSRGLLLDGKPFLPVMGEFHYSRFSETEWRDELLKMKMGGIDIVATYVFWIHHEEIEGQFDWSGQRNLRRFVGICNELEMPLALRIGPWCHGEVRNGGFPDWLINKGWKLRTDDANYLSKVRKLNEEIFAQVKGLFWKDGGNIIAVQLENEFKGKAEHLLTLKKMALETGFDAPLYTRTGWTNTSTPMPLGEIVPLYGVYAEGFWDREITPMPGNYKTGFQFFLARTNSAIATDQLGDAVRKDEKDVYLYPFFCCEIGGGMMTSYHRRILIYPKDIEATALIKIGSGNNLQGYYMYHGGTNPHGKLSTLQESQATDYWNDLPVKSYDFQAPLGEVGQINEHYHNLRRMHLFLRNFGADLAQMNAYLPEKKPSDQNDNQTLRWSARTDGASGFVFVNNYQRLQNMAAKTGVQFHIKLENEVLTFPKTPFAVPENSFFFLPFNLKIADANLIYATAQPICRAEENGEIYLFFAEIANVKPEFVFDDKTQFTGENSRIKRFKTKDGKLINIVLLDEAESLTLWKGKFQNRERIFLTKAGLIIDKENLRLFSEDSNDLRVSIFPPIHSLAQNSRKIKSKLKGIFAEFIPAAPKISKPKINIEQIKQAEPAREIKMGSKGVAEAPSDEDFQKAAVWRVKFSKNLNAKNNYLLRIGYHGDAARIYLGNQLLTDNFYNGKTFEIGLKRYAPEIYQSELVLKILPLRQDAPIYLQDDAKPFFNGRDSVCKLLTAELIEVYEVNLNER